MLKSIITKYNKLPKLPKLQMMKKTKPSPVPYKNKTKDGSIS